MRKRKLGIGIILCISIILLGCTKQSQIDSIEDNPLMIKPIAQALGSEIKQPMDTDFHIDKKENHLETTPQEPRFTIEYMSNTNRLITLHEHYEEFSFFQLPLDDNQFHIRFSKPMNQQSVENVVTERLGKEVAVQFSWVDTQNLSLEISGEASEDKYVLSFTGALDTEGQKIQSQPEFHFKFVQPKAFYTFDLLSQTEKLIYDPKMTINHATLTRNKEYVRFSDQIGMFFAPYFDQYLLNLTSFTWNNWRTSEYQAIDIENEAYRDQYTYHVHFADSIFAIEENKEMDFINDHSGLLFSPEADKVAIFSTSLSMTPFAADVRYAIDLSTYDVESGQLLRTYSGLYHDITEADGTDAPPDDRYLHYKPTYAYWFTVDQILIEYLSEDEQEMRIGILDLPSGDFQTISKGVVNPIISPSRTHFVAIDWEQKGSKVFDLKGNTVVTLETANEHTPIWSDAGDRLLYKDIDGFIKIYHLSSNKTTALKSNMDVAGWLDEQTLLIYK